MVKLSVPYIDQSVKYPTGCESVTTVMLLQHLGYDISVDEFIREYLPQKPFTAKDGTLFGANPNEFFCGSPYDEDAFGCYAPVIVKALNGIFSSQKPEPMGAYHAVNETGTDLETLLRRYLDRGMPVVFWACIEMREPVIGPQWKLYDTEEVFTWISNEHCMLLVGYDETGYYFNDPYDNHGVIRYEKALVEERHKAQYEMAVGVINR
jgi:uncharacterized protein YvpB